jgi:diguanylate cyclase (GGDEF)-like protein
MEDRDVAQPSDAIFKALEQVWLKGTAPAESLPDDLRTNDQLERLIEEMLAVQRMVLALANGDLSQSLKIKGTVAGALKALQANLRHLTWQTQMIAQGDFSQRVDFMGEFSESFNTMVRNLEDARAHLRQREMELTRANTQLHAEIAERERAEEALRQANNLLQTQLDEIKALQAQLREQAIRDPLTQLFNRRYLQETLERELASAKREGYALAVILLDIDHFKQINDAHGHHAGDLMLQALADLLRNNTRQMDVACRYGGEEFVVIMPGAPRDAAYVRVEQLRVAFERLRVQDGTLALQATISLGIAVFPQHGATSDELLRAADDALYAAKAAGRNRAVVAH